MQPPVLAQQEPMREDEIRELELESEQEELDEEEIEELEQESGDS